MLRLDTVQGVDETTKVVKLNPFFPKICHFMEGSSDQEITVTNCQVCCHILTKRPLKSNVIWYPVVVLLTWVLVLGSLYLYLVPFTNLVGQALFADFHCHPYGNVWGVCGITNVETGRYYPDDGDVSAGFLVFIINLITVGFLLVGVALLARSRQFGYFKTHRCLDICGTCYKGPDHFNGQMHPYLDYTRSVWVKTRTDQVVCHSNLCCDDIQAGPCMSMFSDWALAISVISISCIVGIWGGRAIAVSTVDVCLPYADTLIGLYGCVDTRTGHYVGEPTCDRCAAIGFVILGCPLLFLAFLVMIIHHRCGKVKNYFDTQKRELQVEREAGAAATNREPVNDCAPEKVFMENVCIICNDNSANQVIEPCHHQLCQSCLNQLSKRECPFCRGPIKS